MKLHNLGPDFPATLINSILDGDVVFLCGAGVSIPHLPGFEELVKKVYARLNEEESSAELHSINAKRFEEALGSLSRRLARPDDLLDATREELSLSAIAATEHHDLILRISRDHEGKPAVVTTNFDTLFERALLKTRGAEYAAHASTAGQNIPEPGGVRFSGVVHLHGRLADVDLGLDETDLVYTSAQYGEAYLRSGWAGRFLFDLARCRTIVLVGYTASDAPVRYILSVLEADRGRFSDLRNVYALASDREGSAPWEALAVSPLLFETPKINGSTSYEALWESLSRLAEIVDDPDSWRRKHIVDTASKRRAEVKYSEVDWLKWSIKNRADLLPVFVESCKDPEWLDELSQEINELGHNATGWTMATWISQNWEDNIRWDIGVKFYTESSDIYKDYLWQELTRNPPQNPVWRKAWEILIRYSQTPRRTYGRSIAQLHKKLSDGELREADIHFLVENYAPKLRISKVTRRSEPKEIPERLFDISSFRMDNSSHRNFEQELTSVSSNTEISKRILRVSSSALISSLEIAKEIELITPYDDLVEWNVPSVTEHVQNQYRGGFVPLLQLITSCLNITTSSDPNFVRAIADEWKNFGSCITTRLWLHANTLTELYTTEQSVKAVIECPAHVFWLTRPELPRLLARLSGEVTDQQRQLIVDRILSEYNPNLESLTDEDGLKWKYRFHSRDVWLRLSMIGDSGNLPSNGSAALHKIRLSDTRLVEHPTERDFFSGWSEDVKWVRPDTKLFSEANPDDRLPLADEMEKSHHYEQSEGWSEFCRQDLLGSLTSLAHHEIDDKLSRRWNSWLNAVPDNMDQQPHDTRSATAQGFRRLFSEDNSVLMKLMPAIQGAYIRAWSALEDFGISWLDRIVALTELHSTSDAIDIENLIDFALSSSSGQLFRMLLRRASDDLKNHIEITVLYYLERVLQSPTNMGIISATLAVRNYEFIAHSYPMLIDKFIVPRLHADGPISVALRAILIESNNFSPNSGKKLKSIIFRAIKESTAENSNAFNASSHIVRAAIHQIDDSMENWGANYEELRSCVRSCSSKLQLGILRVIDQWQREIALPDRGDTFRRLYSKFFIKVWPRDVKFITNDASMVIMSIIAQSGDAFPEAVKSLVHYIRPITGEDLSCYALSDIEVSKYPHDVVALLWAAFKPPCSGYCYQIVSVLDAALSAEPSLTSDRRIHKLRLRSSVS